MSPHGDGVPRQVCRGCGKPIVFGLMPNGKYVPLDPTPPVYAVRLENGKAIATRLPSASAMVSHFATCSKANEFGAQSKTAMGDAFNKARERKGD